MSADHWQALPPTSVSLNTEGDASELRVRFQAAHLKPVGALLVPVQRHAGEWYHLDAHGQRQAHTSIQASDIPPGARLFGLTDRPSVALGTGRWVPAGPPINALRSYINTRAALPTDARWLLVLLHPQITTDNKDVFKSPPEPDEEQLVAALRHLFLIQHHTSMQGRLAEGLLAPNLKDDAAPASPAPPPLARAPQATRHTNPLCFVAASCQYPSGLLDATPRARVLNAMEPSGAFLSTVGPADRSAALMLMALEGAHAQDGWAPTRAVLMGDQVYVDEAAGVFDAAVLAADGPWGPTYARQENQPVWRRLRSALDGRCLAMPDDHEFVDNWSRPPDADTSPWAATARQQLKEGLTQYRQHQRSLWPAHTPQPVDDADPLWLDMGTAGGPWPFFMADTRTERAARTLRTLPHDHIMGAAQRHAIEQWLARGQNPGGMRFLISASAVLPRPISVVREPATALHHDNWCGYPASQAWLLEQIYEHRAHNLVLLSGDEHLSSVGTVVLHRPGGHHVRVALVHSSALYAPYPFANAQPRDLVVPDAFTLPGSNLQVSVESLQFVPGDGFAIIQCPAAGAASDPVAASLQVRFVRHHSQTHEPLHIDLSLQEGVWRGGESPPHQS